MNIYNNNTIFQQHAEAKLFSEKDEPTEEHFQMLLWAYSPEASRIKKSIPEVKDRKRRSSGGDDSAAKKLKE